MTVYDLGISCICFKHYNGKIHSKLLFLLRLFDAKYPNLRCYTATESLGFNAHINERC